VIRRRYSELHLKGGGKGVNHQTHYRTAGSGPPLILLHPSPMSSAFMLPLIELLHDQVTVLAPDTPGYGLSDPLPVATDELSPYVEWLAAFVRSHQFKSVGVYGSATGAQIAIQFARTHPELTEYLVLDNAVHFLAEEREEILANYFPDMSVKEDGSHLHTAWQMSSSLFTHFPWFDRREESRIADSPAPAALVHATALAYLNAGENYHQAYRAAFLNEDGRNMQAIKRPTHVIRWDGSILKKYADRLDDFDWPEHIRMVQCDASVESRYVSIRSSVAALRG
jgi:pimeloyl-ACP methyl ester carboxylesterase